MEPSKGKSNSYQNFELLVKMKYCSVVRCIKWVIMKYLKYYEMELPKFFLKIYQTYTQNSMCIYNIQFKKKKSW